MKRFIFTIILFFGGVGLAQAQQAQIIAVAAVDRTENSEISSKAARAPYYLIFDTHGKLLEVVSNPFHNAARRAGPKVAELLAGKKVTALVAEGFGNKMKTALDEEGIRHEEASGIVKEVVQDLLREKQPKE